jgi:ABC-2 type transport system permease protein
MVRGTPIGALWLPLTVLAVMAVVVFSASTLRFRRDLAPAGRSEPEEPRPKAPGDETSTGEAS